MYPGRVSAPQKTFRYPPLFPWWTWVLAPLTVIVIVWGFISAS